MSDTIPDTATLSCIVAQLDVVLQGTPKYDLDLRKEGQNALTYFSIFRFQYAEDLT